MAVESPSALELQSLAHTRLLEAHALLAAELFGGCWYLGGYAVECALKAVVCRTLGVSGYPAQLFRGALKSHDLAELVQLSGLNPELRKRQHDADFYDNWNLVITWNPQHRYQVGRTRQQVEDFMTALTHAEKGVFTWLSNRW